MPSLSRLAEQYGYPFYLYDERAMAAQWRLLREALPDFDILYSVKTNPHLDICRFMRAQGAGADAASSGEVQKSLAVGFLPDMIYYSAPGKSEAELLFGMDSAVVIADSYAELERLDMLAAEMDRVIDVGLRINPDISFSPGPWPDVLPGAASKFGVDEETLDGRGEFFKALTNIRIKGIHVFLRSQVLSHPALMLYFRHVFGLAGKCSALFGYDLAFINFGGGFGIACGDWHTPLDIAALGGELRVLVGREKKKLSQEVRLLVESGRFLVAKAGIFVTRVEDVKESRGTTYAIAPGILNGFLRPALMHLMHDAEGGAAPPLEPLYSNGTAHRVSMPDLEDRAARSIRKVTVTGTLCTSLDVLARDVLLPDPRPGDILVVDNAGAYAATLSPYAFASFERPVELYMDAEGAVAL